MLKRQRQSSPPPSAFSSSPLIPDSVVDFAEERIYKRRRTLPPTLDGTQRGWSKDMHQVEDEDEYYEETERNGHQPTSQSPQATSSEYQSTNSMLRDLHTLHQHRLLFASSSPLSTTYQAQPVPETQSLPSVQPNDLPSPKNRPQGLLVGPIHTTHLPIHKPGNTPLSSEAEVVTERYENVNKLLGELFLNRRRTLDASPYQSSTS